MFTWKNKIYADAGHYLMVNGVAPYSCPDNLSPTEVEDTLDGFKVEGNIVTWSGGNRAIYIGKNGTYAAYKTSLIKERYSNDDQIAIMLNYESGLEKDVLAYQRMQEWREYATTIAKEVEKVLIDAGIIVNQV